MIPGLEEHYVVRVSGVPGHAQGVSNFVSQSPTRRHIIRILIGQIIELIDYTQGPNPVEGRCNATWTKCRCLRMACSPSADNIDGERTVPWCGRSSG